MLKCRIRTLAVAGGTTVAAALIALSATAASAATTTASAPAHITALAAAAPACVAQTFSIADQGTYLRCVRDEQVLLNNLWSIGFARMHDLMVDGHYGPSTASDVGGFQQDAGIAADEITGPQTWRALCIANADNGFRGFYWHDAGC